MAIDINSVKLLFWAKNLGVKFDQSATLGRMGLAISPGKLKESLDAFGIAISEDQLQRCFTREPCRDLYADELIRALGAKKYFSVDRSDFEGANYLHDLNTPFPDELRGKFDFVLDGGTLEHIFNYPAALKHTLELVRVGGYFLTTPPANGHMGHGFFQCSPELFFSAFSAQNGLAIRKFVIFETYKPDAQYYEVQSPSKLGNRVELNSSPPMSLAILVQKVAEVPIFATPPQQSDYEAAWNVERGEQDVSTPFRRWRVAMNPYWPDWLRKLKHRVRSKLAGQNNPASLTNRRSFRPLTMDEITRERGS